MDNLIYRIDYQYIIENYNFNSTHNFIIKL